MDSNISEFYTDDTESPNYDTLNTAIRNEMLSNKTFKHGDDESTFIHNVEAFMKPQDHSTTTDGIYTTEDEYVPKSTDMFKRLLQLKEDLMTTKKEIDSAVDKYNDNTMLKDVNAYSQMMDCFYNNKHTIDAFINYDVYNAREDRSISDSDDDDDGDTDNTKPTSTNVNEHSSSATTTTATPAVYSLYERYERLTENLLTRIKHLEKDITSSSTSSTTTTGVNAVNEQQQQPYVKYNIHSLPNSTSDAMLTRLTHLETQLTQLEKHIGNWDMFKMHDSLSSTVNTLIKSHTSRSGQGYNLRYQIFKDFGNTLKAFADKNKDNIKIGYKYASIKDLYAVYSISTHFHNIFTYIKLRLSAIKDICTSTEQLTPSLTALHDAIEVNTMNMQSLNETYYDVLTSFDQLDAIMKELNVIDTKIKQKFNV